LRKLSLDEVPQLVNVLRGEMSLIGPRPPIEFEYALYTDDAKARLAVLPGISGLAQVRARGSASFSEMLRLDIEYIHRRSVLLDLKLILATVRAMVKGA
jgi:lipopolysaccharide/colanic/teichoic acid biosynthesis glycosyltransferase